VAKGVLVGEPVGVSVGVALDVAEDMAVAEDDGVGSAGPAVARGV
jgi:hypothetical protein